MDAEPSQAVVKNRNLLPFPRLFPQILSALPPDQSIYLVGGAVRDVLLGRQTFDLDFALAGDALRIARRVADSLGAAYYPLDAERGTGRVVVPEADGGRTMIDFAALRGPDIEADLRARDFTVNAIAMDVHQLDRLIDPLGGAADLYARRLRSCSATSFQDDPVRILRAVRQATAFGLTMTGETRGELRAAIARLQQTSAERRRDEMVKMLAGFRPATCLRVLDMLGVLPEIFPELGHLKGLAQPAPHLHDAWEHSLQSVQKLERLLAVLATREHDPEQAASFALGLAVLNLGRYREQFHLHLEEKTVPERTWRSGLFLAVLFHDVGKAQSLQLEAPEHLRFSGHERLGAKMAARRARAMRLSGQEVARIRQIVRSQARPAYLSGGENRPAPLAIFRFFRDIGPSGVDICLLHLANVLATYEHRLPHEVWVRVLEVNRSLLEAYWEQPAQLVHPPVLVNGHELIERFGLQEGPQIGELLSRLQEAQVTGEVSDRDQALEWLAGQI